MIKGEAANRHRSKSTGPFHTDERLRSAPVSRVLRARPDARIPFGNREIVIGQPKIGSSVYTRTRSNTREGGNLPANRWLWDCRSVAVGREAAIHVPPKGQGPACLPLPACLCVGAR
jgi:hypothetical protein